MTELLIGCGADHRKKVYIPGDDEWKELVTLDFNSDHDPDVLHDLTKFPYPFEDNTFDEVHAYEVLEHTGQQGDFRAFFDQWSEFWRILKPDGFVAGTSPATHSRWAWGDPGHTRIVSPETFVFLSQEQYKLQVGKNPMSDYRFCYKADFESAYMNVNNKGIVEGDTFVYVLKAIKPSRIFVDIDLHGKPIQQ